MVIDEDHYISRVLHEAGEHRLTVDEYGTPFVSVSVRIFVDPSDPGDVAAVNALQDSLKIEAGSARPYTHPDYDPAGLDATRTLLLKLAEGIPDTRGMFGTAHEVDPIRHLLGTAFGWGGLPESEAFYTIDSEPRPATHHRITFRDVPVDAFWSISVYNRDGFFEENPAGVYSLNGVTAVPDEDGAVTIDLAPADERSLNRQRSARVLPRRHEGRQGRRARPCEPAPDRGPDRRERARCGSPRPVPAGRRARTPRDRPPRAVGTHRRSSTENPG